MSVALRCLIIQNLFGKRNPSIQVPWDLQHAEVIAKGIGEPGLKHKYSLSG